MDILFKPRVEATEQMAQNCMDISLSKNQRERTKSRPSDMYCTITVGSSFFLFQFYFTPGNPS